MKNHWPQIENPSRDVYISGHIKSSKTEPKRHRKAEKQTTHKETESNVSRSRRLDFQIPPTVQGQTPILLELFLKSEGKEPLQTYLIRPELS